MIPIHRMNFGIGDLIQLIDLFSQVHVDLPLSNNYTVKIK